LWVAAGGEGAMHVDRPGSGTRKPRLALGDERVVTGGDEADVAAIVRVYEVVCRRQPTAESVAELGEVAGLTDPQKHAEILRRQVARPRHRRRLPALRSEERRVGEET